MSTQIVMFVWSDRGPLGHCVLYIQKAQTTRQPDRHGHTQWGTLGHTEGTNNQSDRGQLGHCILYIQRALATSQAGGRLGTEGTDNQSDRGHAIGHSEAVNCTYRGHRQPVRKGAHSETQRNSHATVYSEGTDNQSDRGHTVGNTGAVNCTFKGYRQPIRQGHTQFGHCTR